MSSSSWSEKLRVKLSGLSDRPSSESIKTVAKWIGFNRKYANDFCQGLQETLVVSSVDKQAALLQVIHEVMILDYEEGPQKWERLAPLRMTFGRFVQGVSASIWENWTKHIPPLLSKWEACHSLEDSSIIEALRRRVDNPQLKVEVVSPNVKQEVAEVAHQDVVSSKPSPSIKNEPDEASSQDQSEVANSAGTESAIPKEEKPNDGPPSPKFPEEQLSPRQSARDSITGSFTAATASLTFDFESYGIPERDDITAVELLEPSRLVMSGQIARDLRNDNTVQLSNLLMSLPDPIREECAKADEEGESYAGLSTERAMEFAKMLRSKSTLAEDNGGHDTLLDMNIQEQLNSIHTYRELIMRQQQAREQVVSLMIASRGKLGAEKTAAAFSSTQEILQTLQRRQQLLVDALELEGIDVSAEQQAKAKFPELAPFDWLTPGDSAAAEEGANKRPRVE
jgi:hypothetical protein